MKQTDSMTTTVLNIIKANLSMRAMNPERAMKATQASLRASAKTQEQHQPGNEYSRVLLKALDLLKEGVQVDNLEQALQDSKK